MSGERAKNISWSWLSPHRGWVSVTMTSIGKFVYMAQHFVLLRLNPFGLRVDREGCWFEPSMSYLCVGLSAEGAKNVSWFWISPFRGWGSLIMTSNGKFVHMVQYYILLQLNPFALRVDS